MTLTCLSFCPDTDSLTFIPHPLPTANKVVHAVRFTCGRRTKKRKQQPAPAPVRPIPELPPLPTLPTRHASLAAPADKQRELYKAAGKRRDLIVQTVEVHEPGSISTALDAGREITESALIVTTTRDAALIAAREAHLSCKGATVIVAPGTRVPGGWQHPAINANSRKDAVIVVATVRAVQHEFLLNGHGRPFLKKVKFLLVSDVTGIVDVAADKSFRRVLRNMTPKQNRKTVVFRRPSHELKHREEKLNILVDMLVRENKEEIKWHQFKQFEGRRQNTVTYGGALKLKFPSDGVFEHAHGRTGKTSCDFSHLDSILHNIKDTKGKRSKWSENIDDITSRILSIPEEIPGGEVDEDVCHDVPNISETTEIIRDNESNFSNDDMSSELEHSESELNDGKETARFEVESENVLTKAASETICINPKSGSSSTAIGVNSMLRAKEPKDITEKVMTGNWAGCYETLCSMLTRDDLEQADDLDEGTTERVVVIFPTARLAECYITMARVDGFEVQDVHRRMTSSKRERGLEWLFNKKKANLFATDAILNTAIPRVDRLIHFGAPSHASEYRKRLCLLGDRGQSVLLIADSYAELILEKLVYGTNNGSKEIIHESARESDRVWKDERLDMTARAKAYLSWIAFWRLKRSLFNWNYREVIKLMNEWSVQTFGDVPVVPSNIAKKMQIRRFKQVKVRLIEPPAPRKSKTQRKPSPKKNFSKVTATKLGAVSQGQVMSEAQRGVAVTDPWAS